MMIGDFNIMPLYSLGVDITAGEKWTVQNQTHSIPENMNIYTVVLLLLLKQPWPIEAWAPPEPWSCAQVSDTKTSAVEPFKPASYKVDQFVRHIAQMPVWIEIWENAEVVSATKTCFCAPWNIPKPFVTLRDRCAIPLKEATAITALTGSAAGRRYEVHVQLSSWSCCRFTNVPSLDLFW